MRAVLASILLSALALPLSAQERFATGEIRVARYTTMPLAPADSQTDPLAAIVHVSFPRQHVHTVGDAVNYLLLRTGYRLTRAEQIDARVSEVLGYPLPEVHRRLGPCTVHTALGVLLGKPFFMTVDPLRRNIAYEVEDANQKVPLAANAPSGNVAVAIKPVTQPLRPRGVQLPLIQPLVSSEGPKGTPLEQASGAAAVDSSLAR